MYRHDCDGCVFLRRTLAGERHHPADIWLHPEAIIMPERKGESGRKVGLVDLIFRRSSRGSDYTTELMIPGTK